MERIRKRHLARQIIVKAPGSAGANDGQRPEEA
jgi:hypothetical protein